MRPKRKEPSEAWAGRAPRGEASFDSRGDMANEPASHSLRPSASRDRAGERDRDNTDRNEPVRGAPDRLRRCEPPRPPIRLVLKSTRNYRRPTPRGTPRQDHQGHGAFGTSLFLICGLPIAYEQKSTRWARGNPWISPFLHNRRFQRQSSLDFVRVATLLRAALR